MLFSSTMLGKRSSKKKVQRDPHVQQAKFNDRLKLPGCQWEWCSAGLRGGVVFMSALGKRTRKWSLWKFTEIIGAESTQLGKGPLGRAFWEQAVVSLRCILLEREGGVWFYHLPGGTMEITMETQLGPKWRHFCLRVSIKQYSVMYA
jgi:hypothetical protein